MSEEWRPIPGFDGYEASNQGRVRSVERTVLTRNGQNRTYRGHVLSPSVNVNGYLKLGLKGRTYRVHRLVALAFLGEPGPGMDACHNDGNRLNNRASNLRWDTRSANLFDRNKHGTDPNRNKTVCSRGHALREPNLLGWTVKRGWRGCLACSRAYGRVKYHQMPKSAMQPVSDSYYADIMRSAA